MFTNIFVNHVKKKLFLSIILVFLIQIAFIYKINIFPASGLFFFDQNKPIMLTYENHALNFKMNYPNNWERSSKITNESLFIAPKDSDSNTSPAGLVVKVMQVKSKNSSINSISNILIFQLKKTHKDFKLESKSYFNIDNKKGIKIVFTATDTNQKIRKAFQIITLYKNKIYIITYKASPEKFSQYENMINNMISSFKFL